MILTVLFKGLTNRCIHGYEKVPEHPEADSLSTNILCCLFSFYAWVRVLIGRKRLTFRVR